MADLSSPFTEIPFGFPGKVFRSPMPFSPYDVSGNILRKYLENKINAVVILTEPHEYIFQVGRDLPAYYQNEGFEVIQLPIQDFGVPQGKKRLREVIKRVILLANQSKNIAIHCMGGLGRTGIFLACMAKQQFGFQGSESIVWVRRFIPGAIEKKEQETFVMDY
jgi:atypical dual specificity phosphatase